MSEKLMEGIAITRIVVAILAVGLYAIALSDDSSSNNSKPSSHNSKSSTYRNSVGGKKLSRKNKK